MAFLEKLKICCGIESIVIFQSLIFLGSTVSLTVLAAIPWDFSPRKWVIDSLSCDSLRIAKALLRSRLSSRESARTFGLFEASQSSLMLRFLLVWRRCLLVTLILAAHWANVGMPSPQ